jgi:hypothetical protein
MPESSNSLNFLDPGIRWDDVILQKHVFFNLSESNGYLSPTPQQHILSPKESALGIRLDQGHS